MRIGRLSDFKLLLGGIGFVVACTIVLLTARTTQVVPPMTTSNWVSPTHLHSVRQSLSLSADEFVSPRPSNKRLTAAPTSNIDFDAAEPPPGTYADVAVQSSENYANGAANRSPSRDARPLLGDKRTHTHVPPMDAARLSCWDSYGKPVEAPTVALHVVTHVESNKRLETAANDEWRALVAWVPSRFMPKQKPGRKANGDIMIPPTKGQEPDFYLREYNATWHVKMDVDSYEYHVQLVHRNALAVCIRERLHLYEMYCQSDRMAGTVPIYHCPCRHCRIPGSHRTKVKQASPKYPKLTPVQKLVGEVIPVRTDETSKCVDGLVAPWLLTKAQIPRLPYEGLHSDLPALLKVQADRQKVVVVSILNKFWIDHLHNAVYSMGAKAGMTNYIIANMDLETLELCVKNRLPCYDARGMAEDEGVVQEGFKRKVTEAMSWIKPRLAVAVLSLGYGFFMADLDITWNKPPYQFMALGVDIAHQCDTRNKFSINSGYYYAQSNERSIQYFKNLMLFRPEENADQTAMKLFSRYDHTHHATNACLDKYTFDMKCNYKIEPTRIKGNDGPHSDTYKWKPFERRREKFGWSILHATCLSGAKKKLLYLRTMNAWFLDDLDAATSLPAHCIALGGRSWKGTTRTSHTPDYPTGVDTLYLQERH